MKKQLCTRTIPKSLIGPKSGILSKSKIWIVVSQLILLTYLIAAPPVSADGPPPDYACRSCHVGDEREITLPSDETLSVGVDVMALGQSAHGSHLDEAVYCTDCHRSQARYLYPHQPNPAQTRLEFTADVSQTCQRCHEPRQKHNPGHLTAEANPNLPICTDCHSGGHAIESAESLAADPVATCQSCHESYDDPQLDAVHQELTTTLTPDQTCQSCHTDQPLYPADSQCKACHGMLQSEMTLSSGDTVSLYVGADTIDDSIHGQHQIEDHNYTPLLCTDCHTDQARYVFPHQPVTPPDARRFTIEMSDLCQECHQEVYDKQLDSTHAEALAEDEIEAATCVDCHGSHAIQRPNEPREQISQTCSQCHATINEAYAESVHGAALLGEENPDVPVCIDCHGVHDISDPTTAVFRTNSPQMCAACHADETMMKKYDLSTHVFDTYVADFHGTTVELFEKQTPDHETNKAVCYDCHGIHNILSTEDANSTVIKENLLETCRQCHPDATTNFPDTWTSHFEPSLEHNPLIYLVDLFYATLIPVTVGGFIFFIITDIFRRFIDRWRAKKEATV